jgi:nucleoside-diphosphate-sugar epimerase
VAAMNALVTGGAGYVGNLLTAALLERGYKVTVVDNFLYGYEPLLHLVNQPRLVVIKADIRDDNVSYLRGQDVVFHLAAVSGYPACEANPHSAQRINVEATRRIAEALDPGQLLVYASTTSLYGADGTVCTEETPIHPSHNLYAATKYEAEKICMQRASSISLRWATVFGVSPRMRTGLLLNDFVERAVHDRAIVLYSPHSKRTFMHVRDSVNGYLFALDHAARMRGRVVNMGSSHLNHSKVELARMIKEYCNFEMIVSTLADKDIRDFVVSFDRAAALGFRCTVSMDQGIRELIKLYDFYDPHSSIRPI